MNPEEMKGFEGAKERLAELKEKQKKLKQEKGDIFEKKIKELDLSPFNGFKKYFNNLSEFEIEESPNEIKASYKESYYALKKKGNNTFELKIKADKETDYEIHISLKKKSVQIKERVVDTKLKQDKWRLKYKEQSKRLEDIIQDYENDIKLLKNNQLCYTCPQSPRQNMQNKRYPNFNSILKDIFKT